MPHMYCVSVYVLNVYLYFIYKKSKNKAQFFDTDYE